MWMWGRGVLKRVEVCWLGLVHWWVIGVRSGAWPVYEGLWYRCQDQYAILLN